MTEDKPEKVLAIPNEHPDSHTVGESLMRMGFMQGDYVCMCFDCDKRFIGAKKSSRCIPCARKAMEKQKALQTLGQVSDSMEVKPLPCPFCNKQPVLDNIMVDNGEGIYIERELGCQNSMCWAEVQVSERVEINTPEDKSEEITAFLIKRWNTRV